MNQIKHFLELSKYRLGGILFSSFLCVCYIFYPTNLSSAPQTPPASVKNAIDRLLNPAKGASALETSCNLISRELKTHVLSNSLNESEFRRALESEVSEVELKNLINKFDKPENIDDFILNTVVYLIKFPKSENFPERLWKLSAIVELHERNSKNKLTKKPFFPALINACSLLPPDNTYNIEGRFLAAKHFGRIGQYQKQENIINELLKRKGLTNEVYFTCFKELGLLNESLGKFEEALAIYKIEDEKINIFPQYIDLRMRSIFINLEHNQFKEAFQIVDELIKIAPEKRKLYSGNTILEEIISLRKKDEALNDYWNHSINWWDEWLQIRRELYPDKNFKTVRIPDLSRIIDLNRDLNLSLGSNNKLEFFSKLDLLLHGLRWSPSLLNDAGTALCFLLPQIQKETNNKTHNLLLKVCDESIDLPIQFNRRAKLYSSISHSSVKEHDRAIDIIKKFLKDDRNPDQTTETIVRLWAHIAINENKDTSGPEKELQKLLSQQPTISNRPQTTLYLSQIYRKNENYDKEKELLLKETQNPKILENKETLQIFISRLKELNNGIVSNNDFSQAVRDWKLKHIPIWLKFTSIKNLNDTRLEKVNPEELILNSRNPKFTQEELLKIKLLIAESNEFDRAVREQAFQQAFSEIYLYEHQYSASRKMLKSVLTDERFPYQLCQQLLMFSMDDALSRGRNRDITFAITHPIIDRNNPITKNAIQNYGRFSATNLNSLESIKECYKDIRDNINSPSSFAVLARIFESSLELGSIELANKISLEAGNWTTPIQLEKRKSILANAFTESIKRSKPNIEFAKSIKSIARKFVKPINNDNPLLINDYKKETNLKKLSEQTAYNWLTQRALHESSLETSPRFWFDLAELMPRDEKQVEFSFLLIETLLKSNINDLEKSFSLFSSPSIIDTDDIMLREKLFTLFDTYTDKDKEPNSHAAMIITKTQSGKIRDGQQVDIDKEWQELDHPILRNIQLPTKISCLMARKNIMGLTKTLNELDQETLLSPEFIDIILPALYEANQNDRIKEAIVVAENKIKNDLANSVRTLDFQSIRFVYKFYSLAKNNSPLPKEWFQSIDKQVKSERDSYSFRILEAEYKENWIDLAKWSGKAIDEYPTYYNYYRPRGLALYRLNDKQSAIDALEIYVKYSKDEIQWHDASELLKTLKSE